jgi:Zn finger protein HypA/HybF involved in hydrogenase expression
MPRRDRELEADNIIVRSARQRIECQPCMATGLGRHSDSRCYHCKGLGYRLETEEQAEARYEAECEARNYQEDLEHERTRRP